MLVTIGFAAEYGARAYHKYSVTKALTYKIVGAHAVSAQCTAAASVYLNGKGDDWLLPAGSVQDFYKFGNISTLKFTIASTATSATLRIQEF